jgi:endonuclease/exonuclease/phosphatase family metal-dependent hydrolase
MPVAFGITLLLAVVITVQAGNPGVITICTFNIQNFGKTKMNDPERVAQLVSIVRKYDLVAVQEISDASGSVPYAFLEKINEGGRYHYEYVCSERTGKQPDDKNSAEQYAFFYNSATVALVADPALYDDSAEDRFAREPYTARFKAKKGPFNFVLVTVHTAPQQAVSEIGSLDEVVKWARKRYNNESEIIVVGDYNASCSYARPEQLDQLSFRGSGYEWIIPDTAKTNLSAGSRCAYDRFVMTTATHPYFTGQWGVDRSFSSKTISDHWPVWAEFRVRK